MEKLGFSPAYILIQGTLYITLALWVSAMIDLLRTQNGERKFLLLLLLIIAPASAWVYWLLKAAQKVSNAEKPSHPESNISTRMV